MINVNLVFHCNYNGWDVYCHEMSDSQRNDLENALVDYSSVCFDDDGEYDDGLMIEIVEEWVKTYCALLFPDQCDNIKVNIEEDHLNT